MSLLHYGFLSVLVMPSFQDFLGKSDPYLEFAKQNPDGSFSPVHRTEVSPWQCHGTVLLHTDLKLSPGCKEHTAPHMDKV